MCFYKQYDYLHLVNAASILGQTSFGGEISLVLNINAVLLIPESQLRNGFSGGALHHVHERKLLEHLKLTGF